MRKQGTRNLTYTQRLQIETLFNAKMKKQDIATEMFDFGLKYVFFDDVIDVERDIMHFKYIQSTMFDNPLIMTG